MTTRAMKFAATLTCLLAGTLSSGCGDDDTEPAADGGVPDTGSAQAGRGGSGGSSDDDAGVTEQSVTIQFKAKLGDQDLECGREYPGQGSSNVSATPQDFRFFVESVKLITKDGAEVPVRFDERAPFQTKDVALLDFTDGTGSCAPGATLNTKISGKVPVGEYSGIVFVNGVPESLNHQNIAVAKPPLQDASTHWNWQSGYRFIIAELLPLGLPEPDADAGSEELITASFIHIGTGGCTGSNAEGFTCSRPNRNAIKLASFDPNRDVIVADLGRLFESVDLKTGVSCHGPSETCNALYGSLGLELATGNALTSQDVFRVE